MQISVMLQPSFVVYENQFHAFWGRRRMERRSAVVRILCGPSSMSEMASFVVC